MKLNLGKKQYFLVDPVTLVGIEGLELQSLIIPDSAIKGLDTEFYARICSFNHGVTDLATPNVQLQASLRELLECTVNASKGQKIDERKYKDLDFKRFIEFLLNNKMALLIHSTDGVILADVHNNDGSTTYKMKEFPFTFRAKTLDELIGYEPLYTAGAQV